VAARIGASWMLPTTLASGSGCGLLALTTVSPRTGVVWAAALCQIAVDEKVTAIAAASGRMRYPMRLSRFCLIFCGREFLSN
jgi:hypothetical protein